jgi:cell wall-associated NlpC family hydrolase
MWVLARTVAVAVFGDDVLRFTVSVVAGLFCVMWLQSIGVTHAIMAQPFGQHWLAGTMGPKGGQATTPATPIAVQPAPPQQPPIGAPAPIVQNNLVATIIANAMAWLNPRVPYLWGGCTRNGVDCSCFVQNVLRASGISGTPRVTTEQIQWARPIARSQAAAADLVFFDNTCSGCGANPTHVGIYLGDGRMIDAGDPVQIEPIFANKNPRFGRIPGL